MARRGDVLIPLRGFDALGSGWSVVHVQVKTMLNDKHILCEAIPRGMYPHRELWLMHHEVHYLGNMLMPRYPIWEQMKLPTIGWDPARAQKLEELPATVSRPYGDEEALCSFLEQSPIPWWEPMRTSDFEAMLRLVGLVKTKLTRPHRLRSTDNRQAASRRGDGGQ